MFGFRFLYAYRGLGRSRRRTALVLSTIAISVITMILAQAFAVEVFRFWIRSTTESGVGDVQIHRAGAWQESVTLSRELSFHIDDDLLRVLGSDSEVAGVATRIEFDGLISAGSRSVYFSGMGIDADTEAIVSPRLTNYLSSRDRLFPPDASNQVIIGRGLADTLGVDAGQSIRLSAYTIDQQLNTVDAMVEAVIDYPDSRQSKRLLYLPVTLAEQLLSMTGLRNELAIKLRDSEQVTQWVQRYGAINNTAEFRPWWEIIPPIKRVETIWKSVLTVVCILLFVSTALSLLTAIFLTVTERTVEIGVLSALGAKRRDIMLLFVSESLILGGLGATIGIVVGNFLVGVFGLVGLPLVNPLFPGYLLIYPEIQPLMSTVIALVCVVLAVISSIPAAQRAARVQPVVAFRGQLS